MRYSLVLTLFIFTFFPIAEPKIARAETTEQAEATSSGTVIIFQDEDSSPENIRRWRRRSSEVEQKINSLGATPVSSIPIPILFGVTLKNLSPNFGDPRDGGARSHEGEDIMSQKGMPIVSPTPAVVLRISTGASSGLTVRTANPGGETFVYMHLDKFAEGLAEGTLLTTGDLIGYVGNTGNASGGAAHLHFEVRNGNGQPTDPYPRLTSEFTTDEKTTFLNKILTQTSDPAALSAFLAGNATVKVTTYASAKTPAGDLDIGSTGVVVTNLQKFLIKQNVGPAAQRLSVAGATGSFGPLTQAALAELQKSAGIFPASGYYGPVTRAYVESKTSAQLASGITPTGVPLFPRNLKKGMTGEDVKTLQQYLNTVGFLVAQTGTGSPGNESTYFGTATVAALIRFQNAHKAEILTPAGLSVGTGYFGEATRSFIIAAM